ncbi:MAG: type II toxin-antitoxin system Phd/YefM family antitoxin [Bacteroidales bacterium]|nr:type II toxin-antitoxin system Phd/YefM family antitoxin [Bacteroidales bacterium]
MNTITIKKAITDFPKIIENTVNNFEETVIVSEKGAVVLIAQSEWNNIMETIKLLKDKQSLKALIEGHNIRNSSNKTEGKTIQQAFYDL